MTDLTKITLTACNRCGWIHVRVSKKSAKVAVDSFNEMYDNMPEASKQLFSNKKATLEAYLTCFYCGNSYKEFHLVSAKEYKSQLINQLHPIMDSLEA